MKAVSNNRYVVTRDVFEIYVTDSYTGKTVFKGSYDACRGYAEQHNDGNAQAFFAWQNLARGLLKQQLIDHPTPWSIQRAEPIGMKVIAADGTLIMNADNVELAGWILQLGDELELEMFPDGRM